VTCSASNDDTPYLAYVNASNKLGVMKYAQAPTFTVTYNAGAHGTLSGATSETVTSGGKPSNVPGVTPANGFGFVGWSSDGGTTKYSSVELKNQTVAGEVTYTAYYQAESPGSAVWKYAGSSGFSDEPVNCVSMARDSGGKIYVAYREQESPYRAVVKTYDSAANTWNTVGAEDLSGGGAAYLSLAVSESGTPYVAYAGCMNGLATVKKFNSGTNAWETIGTANFTNGMVSNLCLAVGKDGTAYVAFRDDDRAYNVATESAVVMKYTGHGSTGWEIVGVAPSGGSTTGESLAVSGDGTIYIAYTDLNGSKTAPYKTMLAQYTGSGSIKIVGGQSVSDNTTGGGVLALDSAGNPYVLFCDIDKFKLANDS
jgi:hypothetical protein